MEHHAAVKGPAVDKLEPPGYVIKKRRQGMRLLFHVVKGIDQGIGEEVFAIRSVFQCLHPVLTPTILLKVH